jgi:hypothetical protein
MPDKVIVTNEGALRAKYGEDFDVHVILAPLRQADATRGVQTTVVRIDDAGDIGAFNSPPVTDPSDQQQVKGAIDAVFAADPPDYLMLLGAGDVVPHQDLDNPLYHPDDPQSDPDQVVPSDLPYACESPYSRAIPDFAAPTRVVGRLPDVTGATEPGALQTIIATAVAWQSRGRSDYEPYFGLTAEVWNTSTELSLRNTFGSSTELHPSPDDGPAWDDALLGRRSHFINCHGAQVDPHFYGQRGPDYPIAHESDLVQGHISEGTVATAECCYGAELYDPGLGDGTPGLCLAYLLSGAYGFFGSTTVAYGPADSNDSADLICQYFLQRILAGASLGRAALEAQQDYVRAAPLFGPQDQKTLAQFVLLGDPSVHPVAPARPGHSVAAFRSDGKASPAAALGTGRTDRRRALAAKGLALRESTSVALADDTPPPAHIAKTLTEVAGTLDIDIRAIHTFAVREAPALAKTRFPVTDGQRIVVASGSERHSDAPVTEYHLLIAVTDRDEVSFVKQLRSK